MYVRNTTNKLVYIWRTKKLNIVKVYNKNIYYIEVVIDTYLVVRLILVSFKKLLRLL